MQCIHCKWETLIYTDNQSLFIPWTWLSRYCQRLHSHKTDMHVVIKLILLHVCRSYSVPVNYYQGWQEVLQKEVWSAIHPGHRQSLLHVSDHNLAGSGGLCWTHLTFHFFILTKVHFIIWSTHEWPHPCWFWRFCSELTWHVSLFWQRCILSPGLYTCISR